MFACLGNFLSKLQFSWAGLRGWRPRKKEETNTLEGLSFENVDPKSPEQRGPKTQCLLLPEGLARVACPSVEPAPLACSTCCVDCHSG